LKKLTTTFCKNNSNILFTRADKGNVTIDLVSIVTWIEMNIKKK